MTDLIGDIHGHADKLEALLVKLGYTNNNGCYSHPERKVLFVGDYIDRGPQIIKTLEIVKSMVDNGHAIALMGNHEYNALCFHIQEREGGHLRKHLIKNIIQHYETLKQFQNRQEEYEFYLEWFKTLPLFYETGSFRAVHACWDIKSIAYLQAVLVNNRLNDSLIYDSVARGSALYNALDIILKGKEIKMPAGFSFTDKDGTLRRKARIRWWEDPSHTTYSKIIIEPLEQVPELAIDNTALKDKSFYEPANIPVFFGHYWLKGMPELFKANICCLDYSVAKRGHLVAYRFDGEMLLDEKKFLFV